MQLILVRHALPDRVAHDDGSTADPSLTPEGEAQAGRLVAALRDDRVDALWSSPMHRALETAAPLAAALGAEPTVSADLREYDAEGRAYTPIAEMADADPDVWERMRSGLLPTHVDVEAFSSRVVRAVEDVVAAHPGKATAVVVAHAGVINAYLASVLEIPRPLPFPLDYVGVSRVICARGGRRRVRTVNEVAHVADLL
ncbi:putative phosphoglycerate mutase [Pseudonocardia sediminis]|uniref:Putative phosphoglycerate mutase n=1 Tax=Pseudonocardia sediminis TaxID=1397368 RepID=A0A4Q7UYL2_PSEST|nr:histidine phosphatase family protein [Pseudonocardia sediminis]RZT85269.1 putative phosphoglycerate mutase [Pseudonocardia sediminis]